MSLMPRRVQQPTAEGLLVEAQRILDLALARPAEAVAAAQELLAGSPSALVASMAHQTIGIVAREHGDAEAIPRLRTARRLARRANDSQREADVMASLGVALVEAGSTAAGLRELAAAVELSEPAHRPRMLVRRSYALLRLGRATPALADLDEALPAARARHDRLWEARCLVNTAWAYGVLGDVERAEWHDRQAGQLFTELGQEREAAVCVHNLSDAAWSRADLPRALALLDEVDERMRRLGSRLVSDDDQRCTYLLGAGLADEALAVGTRALEQDDLPAAFVADLLRVTAGAALAAGDHDTAHDLARRARRAFIAQRRPSQAHRAQWIALRAKAAGDPGSADVTALRRVAAALEADGSAEAPAAHLAAAEAAYQAGRTRTAQAELAAAARSAHSSHPLQRALGQLALARSAETTRTRLLACRRGLDALDEHRLTLGDPELRATSTSHARSIVELALRTVVDGSPRRLLAWVERARASALARPPVLPPDDPQLAAAIAGVRETTRRLADATDQPELVEQLTRERTRFEAEVRRHYRRIRSSPQSPTRLDVAALLARLGEVALLSLVEIDATLYALLVHGGRVSRHRIGPTSAAIAEGQQARFALRRAAYGRQVDLDVVGERLSAAVLGGLAQSLPERVVIVPPATLQAVPWGVLPAAADRVVSLAPSAAQWLVAAAQPSRRGPVVAAAGPGLAAAGRELAAIRRLYAGSGPDSAAPLLLEGEAATSQAVARAVDGAAVAHIAAHGTFRSDAPLFSSLWLADGPLHLHDLHRLDRPPHTVLLSACDVGENHPVGLDEALGLVSGLLGLGVREILAAVVPVADEAAAEALTHVHGSLSVGSDLATAWLAARRAGGRQPATRAAAASFIAWGP